MLPKHQNQLFSRKQCFHDDIKIFLTRIDTKWPLMGNMMDFFLEM